MGQINIANSKNRDAVVYTRSVSTSSKVRYIDEKQRQVENRKILRATLDRDIRHLKEQVGDDMEALAQQMIDGDPEVGFEKFGSFLGKTARAYIDQDGKLVHRVVEWDIVRNPDGSVRERRSHKATQPNINEETPLKWTGKLMKKEKVYNKFVFSHMVQIMHYNGLTYDFLFTMAKDLEEKESLMLLGAGPKNNQPLVFQRNGTPYRGFLEGRTKGDKYALILHLSNMELKKTSQEEEGDDHA